MAKNHSTRQQKTHSGKSYVFHMNPEVDVTMVTSKKIGLIDKKEDNAPFPTEY